MTANGGPAPRLKARARIYVCILTLAIVMPAAGQHGMQIEKLNGPYDGAINSVVALDQDRLLVSTPEGYFGSGDGGVSWQRMTSGPPPTYRFVKQADGSVRALTVHGVYESDDSGESWDVRFLPGHDVRAFIDLDSLLLAGVNGEGILASVDGGLTWEPRIEGLHAPLEYPVTGFAAAADGHIIAIRGGHVMAEAGGGVYRSPDGGRNWSFAPGTFNAELRDVLRLPDGRLVIAGFENVWGQGGLFYSIDHGETWEVGTRQSASVLTRVTENRVVAGTASGLSASDDGGRTWSNISSGLGNVTSKVPLVGGGWLVGTREYCYPAVDPPVSCLSTTGLLRFDGSDGYRQVGFRPSVVYDVDRWNGHLIAAADNGLFISADEGRTWRPFHAARGMATSLYVHRADTLLIGTDWAGVLRAPSGADAPDYGFEGIGRVTDMAWHPATGLLAGVSAWLYGAESGVYRYIADEYRWASLLSVSGDVSRVVAAPSLHIMAATTTSESSHGEGEGIFRSGDAGETWHSANAGLDDLDVTDLTLDDRGRPWATVLSGGLFVSDPFDIYWNLQYRGGNTLHAVAVSKDGQIFIADSEAIRVSDNEGVDFTTVMTFGVETVTHRLTVLDDGYLYAATDRGLYRSDAAVILSADDEPRVSDGSMSISVYPNPVQTTASIRIRVPEAGPTNVSVYDLLGRLGASVFEGYADAGVRDIQWSVDGLPAGVYFLVVTAGGRSVNHRLVIAR